MPGVAGEVKIIFSADTNSYTASVKKAKEQLGVFEKSAVSAGSVARQQMNEARGSVMVLGEEIGVHLPRHVQKFVAGLPGVASAMSAAFSSIAVIAIGAAIFEAGKKVYEFVEKNEEAARRNAAAWQAISAPMQETNDELRLANDKIENAIAKLEYKPQNAMKEAIDEAIVSADKLGAKLQQDASKIESVLADQQVSWAKQRLLGFAGTSDITDRAKGLQDTLGGIDIDGRKKLNQLRSQGATEEELAAATTELNAKRKAAIDAELTWAQGELDAAKVKRGPRVAAGRSAVDPRISLLTNYSADLGEGSDFLANTQTQATNSAKQKQLQAKKDLEDGARQAAAKRIEQAKQTLDAMKADHQVGFDEEAGYWQKIADASKRGSTLYNTTLDLANKARAAGLKQYQTGLFQGWMEDAKRKDRENPKLQMPAPDALGQAWLADQKTAEEVAARFKENAVRAFKDSAEAIKVAERQEEESIQLLFERGAISAHSAALQTQAVHAESFAAWAKASGDLSAQFPEMATPAGAETMGSYEMQARKDAADVRATTALGDFSESLARMARQFTNVGDILANEFTRNLEGFNETFMRVLSTPRSWMTGQHPWRQLGSNVAESAGGAALRFSEGELFKALGFGGGEKRQKVSAHIENWPGAGSGSVASTATHGLLGVLNDSDWASKLFGGSLFGSGGMFSHLPGFATGGAIPSNMPAIVGERGPELFMPSSAGTIIPNNAFGGGGDVQVHVDARGAGDPAAVNAAVHRAMQAYIPQIRDAGPSSIRDYNRRVPSKNRI